MSIKMKRGQIVECIEKPGYLSGFSRGKTYVVNAVKSQHGAEYIVILGDDARPHTLLSNMFRLARAAKDVAPCRTHFETDGCNPPQWYGPTGE